MILGAGLLEILCVLAFVLVAAPCATPGGRWWWVPVELAALLALGQWLGWWDWREARDWLAANPYEVIALSGLYVVAGVAWSLVKWRVLLGRHAATMARLLRCTSGEDGDTHARGRDWLTRSFRSETGHAYPVTAFDHKSELTLWTALWPLSVVGTVVGDWLVRLWERVYDLMAGVYQLMAESRMGDVHGEFVRRDVDKEAAVAALRRAHSGDST